MIKHFVSYLVLVKNIYATAYDQNRRYWDRVVSLWVYYVTRPISIVLTPFFLRLKISANLATFFGLTIGLMSLSFNISGDFFVGAMLYNLFLVFDSIDGNIARFNKSSSSQGEYFDAVSGDIVNIFLLPSFGLGYFYSNGSISSLLNIHHEHLILYALTASLMYLNTTLQAQRAKLVLNESLPGGPTRIKIGNSILLETMMRNSYGFAFNAPISIITALTNTLDLLIVYNLFIATTAWIYSIFRGYKSVDST